MLSLNEVHLYAASVTWSVSNTDQFLKGPRGCNTIKQEALPTKQHHEDQAYMSKQVKGKVVEKYKLGLG